MQQEHYYNSSESSKVSCSHVIHPKFLTRSVDPSGNLKRFKRIWQINQYWGEAKPDWSQWNNWGLWGEEGTLGGIASICFRCHLQQALQILIQGCQKIRKNTWHYQVDHSPIIEYNQKSFGISLQFLILINFGNENFWISHKISGLFTPLTPLCASVIDIRATLAQMINFLHKFIVTNTGSTILWADFLTRNNTTLDKSNREFIWAPTAERQIW